MTYRFNYDPQVEVPPKHYPVTDPAGVDRHKFFKRPIIPFLPQMPPSIVLAPQLVTIMYMYSTCKYMYVYGCIIKLWCGIYLIC